jgi:hypothetical protein
MHRVKILWTGAGIPQGGVSTFYFDYAASGAQTAADAAFWLMQQFSALMSNRYTFTEDAIVSQVVAETGDVFGVSPISPLSESGDSSTEEVPQAAQALVQWRTGVYHNSREVRGRTFIPGILQTYCTDGQLDAGIVAGYADELNTFITSKGAVPVIWHRPKPGEDGAMFAISSGALWPEFATLRRRR